MPTCSDASQQKAFLRQIGQAIMQEEPETRRRILGRLRALTRLGALPMVAPNSIRALGRELESVMAGY